MAETPPSNKSTQSIERSRAFVTQTQSIDSSFNASRHHISVGEDLPVRVSQHSPPSYKTDETHDITALALDSPVSKPRQLGKDVLASYYLGVPSRPRLIATSNERIWHPRNSASDVGYQDQKQLLPVNPKHNICKIWDSALGQKLLNVIDKYTSFAVSVDIVKICYAEDAATADPIIWIGILPGKMDQLIGQALVEACLILLREHNLIDVQIEVKESHVFQLDGPPLMDVSEISSICSPFVSHVSAACGLPITTRSRPFSYGTGSFFIKSSTSDNGIFLITCQHVVSGSTNVNGYNAPLSIKQEAGSSTVGQTEPVVLSDEIFGQHEKALAKAINDREAQCAKTSNTLLLNTAIEKRQEVARANLKLWRQELEQLIPLQEQLKNEWSCKESRVLGSVYCYPQRQFSAGEELYTEDWALVRMDATKLPPDFSNTLDLNSRSDFDKAEYGDAKPLLSLDTPDSLVLRNVLTREDMAEPLAVLIRGATSGLSLGLSSPVDSYQKLTKKPYREDERPIPEGLDPVWSREWPILAMGKGSESFSAPGDSGAGVVSRDGRYGGIVTGGGGHPKSPDSEACVDVTYVTPLYFIMNQIKKAGFRDPELL